MCSIRESEPPARCTASRQSVVGVVDERIPDLRGHDDPGRLGELGLELAGAPARVAREQAHPPDREQSGSASACTKPTWSKIGAAASSTSANSASAMNACGCTGPPTKTGAIGARQPFERRHRLRGRDVRGPAEHEAERPVVVVVGDQDDGLAEVRVDQ